ncbi:hypothetical protein [Pedobacter gandavensis]|uniref:hypothetical protein n=1 Tax=Pedobacter gandavensis TaxID=2679963 RepID=UPI0029307EF5|nr:hypothetical protein [Pedobacter gandavensis]
MKKSADQNELGAYLANQSLKSTDICKITGLRAPDLSKLSSGITSRLPADTFYRIHRAINSDIVDMLTKVFPKTKLNPDWQKRLKNKKLENTSTDLGFLLLNEENSRAIISAKTGITVERLRDLSNKISSELLAEELYLIELAYNKTPGEFFTKLYKDLRLNTLDE